jgi:hypothetical protein
MLRAGADLKGYDRYLVPDGQPLLMDLTLVALHEVTMVCCRHARTTTVAMVLTHMCLRAQLPPVSTNNHQGVKSGSSERKGGSISHRWAC